MTVALARKLFRDVRVAIVVILVLLGGFQCLWAKITERITGNIIRALTRIIPLGDIQAVLFAGPGKILQTLMGGESISLERAQDILSIGYVHPLTLTILCVWAIGRASAAIAGEIDRGTIELLLAQPLARVRLVLAHLLVDAWTIPLLCLSLFGGTCLGAWLVDFATYPDAKMQVEPLAFGPSLLSVGALLFAVSGYTMWLSARGRFRGRVLGLAVLLTLVQFLVNVVGQLWDAVEPLRPFTVFYYYQPQRIILQASWATDGAVWGRLLVLVGVGAAGYLGAFWTFSRRDLPAPL
jgi:ABC-2 type transport system permease protein